MTKEVDEMELFVYDMFGLHLVSFWRCLLCPWLFGILYACRQFQHMAATHLDNSAVSPDNTGINGWLYGMGVQLSIHSDERYWLCSQRSDDFHC